MPKIYLSPSVQEFNHYVDGGNEEYYMYLIADAMEPYLRANGIAFDRNQPQMTLSQVISDANAQPYDLHLAIHSNASPDASAGQNTGVAEVRRTKAPAVLIEVGYHDNRGEAQWIRDNIDNIARTLAKSVTEYFHQEFIDP